MLEKNGIDDPLDLPPSDSAHSWGGSWKEKRVAVYPSASPTPCLLLIEADAGWQTFLKLVLREEGYALEIAASLEHALAHADRQVFDLILLHLNADNPRQLLQIITAFQERVQSTKLGVITHVEISSEVAEEQGLAFIMSTPVALEPLLAEIAICLQRPVLPAQARHAQVVRQFLEGLPLKEHQKVFGLCTDDLVCYSLPSSPVPLARTIRGKDALELCVQALRSRYRALRVEVQHIYSRPKGLVAQYILWWVESEGIWEMKSGASLLQFSGERLRQIGLQAERN